MPLDDARHGDATAAATAAVATAAPPPPVASIGHNGGPPLDEPPRGDWNYYCWRRAHKRAWKTPPREIALRRLARAEALGMSYREYQAVILDRGIYLDERPAADEQAGARTMRKRMGRR